MNNNSSCLYVDDDIEKGNNNKKLDEVEVGGHHHQHHQLGRSLSIIEKGQIKIDKLTVESPILVTISPNKADRELIIDVLRKMDANKDGVIDYEELVQYLLHFV